MIREKEYSDIKIENVPNNIEIIKSYFEKKKAICHMNSEMKEFEYLFEDKIHSKIISVCVMFYFKIPNNSKIKIVINANEIDNEYEIDDYSNKIFSDIYMKLLEGTTNYVVRIYGKYYNAQELDLEASIKWKNKINIIPFKLPNRNDIYEVETMTCSPKEQLLFFDIEVSAFDLSSARTIAYNRILELNCFLTVLLDLGIELYQSEQVFALADVETSKGQYTFYGTAINKGFHDEELDLFIYDNLNGVIAFYNDKMVTNSYLSFTMDSDDSKTHTITLSEENEQLDIIFKNHKLKNISKKYPRGDINRNISFYNTKQSILSSHISFFRKLNTYEQDYEVKYEILLNACKLYTKALTTLSNEPTMMISYLIASIEALLKTEKEYEYISGCKSDMEKFLVFSEKYIDKNKYDRNYLKYLYGNIRSGHFHSGEFKFYEFAVKLNQSFNIDFFESQKQYYKKAKETVRTIFINWLEQNILNQGE